MNDQQKEWIDKLKALVNGEREDSVAAYEKLTEDVQELLDHCPEP